MEKSVPEKTSLPSVATRKRMIRTLYFIGFMDLCGVAMIITLIPKLILNLGASPFLAGLIGSIYGGVQIVSSPLLGRLSDVYGRKPILFLSYAGPALGYFTMGFSSSLWMVALARVLLGLLKQGLSVSKAHLMDIVSPSQQQSVLGYFNSCSSFGFIIGPLIGGELAALDGSLQLPFLACGIVFVAISAVVLVCLPGKNQVPYSPVKKGSRNDGALVGLKAIEHSLYLFRDLNVRALADLVLLRFLMTLAVITFRTNYPLYLEEIYGVDYKSLGKVMAFNGVLGALSSALSGRLAKMYNNVSTLFFHESVILAVSLSIALSSSAFLAIAALVPLSLATTNLRVTSSTMMLARVPPSQKGTVIGLGNSVASLSRMIAPLLVGVAQESSTTAACVLSVVFSLIASGLAGSFLVAYW